MARSSKRDPDQPPAPNGVGARLEPRTFDLDQVDPADAVRLGGKSYRLMTSTGLSLIQKAKLNRAWKRMSKIEEKLTKDQLTQPDQNEYRQLSEEVAQIALPDAPADVIARCRDELLDEIIVTFFARTAVRSRMLRMLQETMPASALRSRISRPPTAVIN